MRKIDCAHRKILKKFYGGKKMEKIASILGVIFFNFLTPGKFFQNFSMRAIDSSHKLTPKNDFVGVKTYNPLILTQFFPFFDPRKNFSEFFDARNRFLA